MGGNEQSGNNREDMMREKTTLWLLLTGMIAMTLMLSGCFFSEQTLIISPDGTTDIKIEFWFEQGQAGDQGSIGIQKLLYLFHFLFFSWNASSSGHLGAGNIALFINKV